MCGIRSVDCVLGEHVKVLGMSCLENVLVGESACMVIVPQATPVNLYFCVAHSLVLQLEGKPRLARAT